ncbi:MAG: tripartite tricarboxylate transporter substrate binding protein [Betaproteobacteria bacterium]|nr:tripartite tricarboxylate transporter substrate binding protein [Betaproteobacteria bacterium]
MNIISDTRPNRLRRLILSLPIAGAGSQVLAQSAGAPSFPDRPLTLVVPFPAGGPADIVGRLYAQHLARIAGQNVVVDNRVGAAGVIGTQAVVAAAPSGHTILFGSTSTQVINELLIRKLPYDAARDLSLIGLVAIAPHLLAVRAGLAARTVEELVAAAKRDPGRLSFSSAGPGSIVQMGGELLKLRAGVDLLHVPYKGGGPATLAVLSGEADMTVNDLTTLRAHIESGKLRALAVAHDSRLPQLPAVPTFAEAGVQGMLSSTWWAISVPSKTPPEVRGALRALHERVVSDPDYTARLAAMACQPLVMDPARSATFINDEASKWRAVVSAAKIESQ